MYPVMNIRATGVESTVFGKNGKSNDDFNTVNGEDEEEMWFKVCFKKSFLRHFEFHEYTKLSNRVQSQA